MSRDNYLCFFKPKVRKEDKFNGEIRGPGTYTGSLGEWLSYISDLRSLNEYILIFLNFFLGGVGGGGGGANAPFGPNMAPLLVLCVTVNKVKRVLPMFCGSVQWKMMLGLYGQLLYRRVVVIRMSLKMSCHICCSG